MIGDFEANYLWDIKDAAEHILRFTRGLSLQAYLSNELTRSAVERQLIRAANSIDALREASATLAGNLPSLPLSAFRNVIMQGYTDLDHHLVWRIVQESFPSLVSITALLLE